MARRLKTYQTSLGFFDLAIAAPSMKAAAEAWGTKTEDFTRGFAKQTDDPAIVAATMGKPGVVLKRPVGSNAPFSEHAELPKDLPDKIKERPPKPRPTPKNRHLASSTKKPAARRRTEAAREGASEGRVAASLEKVVGDVRGLIVSAYWPFRGEPDLRGFMAALSARGERCALPVVVERGKSLVFRPWSPGERLVSGVWNIPVPATTEEVLPDVVIAPVVGFDRSCYRLGYGGGFFDRTLATMKNSPRKLGVGYRQQALLTIHPQPNDIHMDRVLTEEGAFLSGDIIQPTAKA
jgi:5-formyltetrahydrofolate cyclo-ligase